MPRPSHIQDIPRRARRSFHTLMIPIYRNQRISEFSQPKLEKRSGNTRIFIASERISALIDDDAQFFNFIEVACNAEDAWCLESTESQHALSRHKVSFERLSGKSRYSAHICKEGEYDGYLCIGICVRLQGHDPLEAFTKHARLESTF